MRKGLVDSMVLMHYDNAHEGAVEWWEGKVEDGWKVYISEVSLMERLKGVAGLSGSREAYLKAFRFRIQQMKKERKICRILPVTRDICRKARLLLEQYCKNFTPSPKRGRMEALICDMFIAATALKYDLILFTQNLKDFEWIDALNVEEADYEIQEEGEAP